MSYLRCLCLFAYGVVQHTLCCVVALFVFVLQVSLDCPFFIAPFVFTDVYFRPVSCVTGVASFSGLSFFDCPFGIL